MRNIIQFPVASDQLMPIFASEGVGKTQENLLEVLNAFALKKIIWYTMLNVLLNRCDVFFRILSFILIDRVILMFLFDNSLQFSDN